jgi:hypothetical protein
VDLPWNRRGRQAIAEVKSWLDDNDPVQLRLGMGQVLECRHRLAANGVHADAVMLISQPNDTLWNDICHGVHVRLLSADNEASWDLGSHAR